jgi:hypothetical protein
MPDSAVRIGEGRRGSFSGRFETKASCQVNFETLLCFDKAVMSARETAELLLLVGRLVQADGYRSELSPAQWMALRFFARANSFSRTSVGIRGISSDDPWHRVTGHQDA